MGRPKIGRQEIFSNVSYLTNNGTPGKFADLINSLNHTPAYSAIWDWPDETL